MDDPDVNTELLGREHTIDWITDNGVSGSFGLDEDHVIFLLADNDADLATVLHCVQEDLVAEDIELLLVIAGGIGRSGKAEQVDQRCAADVVGNELARQLQPADELAMYVSCLGAYALSRIVRSPLAAAPSFCCSWRMCCTHCQQTRECGEAEMRGTPLSAWECRC